MRMEAATCKKIERIVKGTESPCSSPREPKEGWQHLGLINTE